MIACGFGMTAVALYHITNLSLAVDFGTMTLWRMYQMSGLAFIPISILGYVHRCLLDSASIPAEKANAQCGPRDGRALNLRASRRHSSMDRW